MNKLYFSPLLFICISLSAQTESEDSTNAIQQHFQPGHLQRVTKNQLDKEPLDLLKSDNVVKPVVVLDNMPVYKPPANLKFNMPVCKPYPGIDYNMPIIRVP